MPRFKVCNCLRIFGSQLIHPGLKQQKFCGVKRSSCKKIKFAGDLWNEMLIVDYEADQPINTGASAWFRRVTRAAGSSGGGSGGGGGEMCCTCQQGAPGTDGPRKSMLQATRR